MKNMPENPLQVPFCHIIMCVWAVELFNTEGENAEEFSSLEIVIVQRTDLLPR